MDIFSHMLWGNLGYRIIPQTKASPILIGWGIFFSVFPDVFSFSYAFSWLIWHRFVTRKLKRWPKTQKEFETLPCEPLTRQLYNFSHSLVIWGVVCMVAWIIIGKFPWALLGWAIHIIIDIPTHKTDFYPTPFLWPLSNKIIEGYAWASRDFMTFNIMALIMAYILLLYA